jgi:holo-[acyl-carrier protein] synthase
MIVGIGVDIVEVPRVQRLLSRYGERFAARTLAAGEWDEFRSSRDPALYLASRFAAKEAFAKAMGTGLRSPVSLTSIGVTHDELGKPRLHLQADLERLMQSRQIEGRHITLSHERSLACAFVVLEGRAAT